MDLPQHGYLLAFQLRFKKYLLFFNAVDSTEIFKLLSTFLTVPEILNLARANKHLYRMLSYPFIQIRLLRRQVKQLQQQKNNLRLDESLIGAPIKQFLQIGHQENNSFKPIKGSKLLKSVGKKLKGNSQPIPATSQPPATSQSTFPEKNKMVSSQPDGIEFQQLLIAESRNIQESLKRNYKEVAYSLLYYKQQKDIIPPLFEEKRPDGQPVDKKALLQMYRIIEAQKQVRSLLREKKKQTDPSNYILYREYNKLERCRELQKMENEFHQKAKGLLKRDPLEMFQLSRSPKQLQMREIRFSKIHKQIVDTPIFIRVLKNLMLPLWQMGTYVGKISNDHGF